MARAISAGIEPARVNPPEKIALVFKKLEQLYPLSDRRKRFHLNGCCSRRAGILWLAAALVWTGVVAADEDPRTQLEAIERELDEGQSRTQSLRDEERVLGRNLSELQQELVVSAARAQQQEDVVAAFEDRLGTYEAEEWARRAALAARHATIQEVLAALQRISRMPPEAVFASPISAIDSLRTSILLAAVVPDLEARAGALRMELVALSRIRAEIGAERDELGAARARLDSEQRALDRLIQRKANLRERTAAERRETEIRLAALAADAADLRGLIAKLEEDASAEAAAARFAPGPEIPSFSAALGSLPLPVRGVIIARFGDPNSVGGTARGLRIATREGAPVIAPHDGQIVFAGAFRSYGQLLIIAHGEGYHTLLAGIARIDGSVGQLLLAGEPVGQMGQLQDGKPELYVELRHDGDPIDPFPWLAPSELKVSR